MEYLLEIGICVDKVFLDSSTIEKCGLVGKKMTMAVDRSGNDKDISRKTGRQVASKGTLLPNAPASAFASRKGAFILVDGAKYYWSGSAWVDENGREAKRVGEPSVEVPTVMQSATTPSASAQGFVRPRGPPSQVKVESSKISLTQSLLKICEGNKEFSMARSDESDLILEEKAVPQEFLGITVGTHKKGYRARIWLDETKKEVKYQDIEERPQNVGVIPPGKGGFGIKPETLGKAQEKPMADRMRGSIRQVVESAGWRLSYAN